MLLDEIVIRAKVHIIDLLLEECPLHTCLQCDPAVPQDELVRQVVFIFFRELAGDQAVPGQLRPLLKGPVLCLAALFLGPQERRRRKDKDQQQEDRIQVYRLMIGSLHCAHSLSETEVQERVVGSTHQVCGAQDEDGHGKCPPQQDRDAGGILRLLKQF